MRNKTGKICLISLVFTLFSISLRSQELRVTDFVNPFIGTGRADAPSFWGAEGGTYPGAVAPSGFIQITPETNVSSSRGYNYRDSTIFFFSCTGHMSGYPNGAAGSLYIMPLPTTGEFLIGKSSRRFSHQNEKAEPGYYSVMFRDDGTMVEASASERSGMLLITFPIGTNPAIMISDIGKIENISKREIHGSDRHAVVVFSQDITGSKALENSTCYSFKPAKNKETKLLIRIGLSSVSYENANKNISSETGGKDFGQYKEENHQKWEKALSVIEISDRLTENKIKFYTALYHSLLLPWIISDTDGSYTGADKKIHQTKGSNQYSGFSAWDTFRSLHPLLCLIAPAVQNDIVLSMLDYSEQTGRLPGGPMTGNHVVAIIADSWMKGIRGFDPQLALRAMTTTLESAKRHPDMADYLKSGYVASAYPESVTKTVEYAYDDWVTGQFAGSVNPGLNTGEEYLSRCHNYRNIFDPLTLCLIPRKGNEWNRKPGYFGYKEGDKNSYSMFVPHDPVDLINLLGGTNTFTTRLDSALANRLILFDNEPVLHVPYLFNYSLAPSETQKWVRNLMRINYRNSPGGLPGNDDLGAMSSWFVFSAMGFYPVCPGRPDYDLGSPLFEKIVIHLTDNKFITINSENNGDDNIYVKSVFINGKIYNSPWISHSQLTSGAVIDFSMDKKPHNTFDSYRPGPGQSVTEVYSDIRVTGFEVPGKSFTPDQPFMLRFSATNSGSQGTKRVILYTDGKEYSEKYVWAGNNSIVKDSVECRLYPVGTSMVRLDELPEKPVTIYAPGKPEHRFEIINPEGTPLVRTGTTGNYSYTLKNLSGYTDSTSIKILLNDSLIATDHFELKPGEKMSMSHTIHIGKPGMYLLRIGTLVLKMKSYDNNLNSSIINLAFDGLSGNKIISDSSGFSNNGIAVIEEGGNSAAGKYFRTNDKAFIEFSGSPSIDMMGEKITVMAWVHPGPGNKGLSDIITKGDFIAMQSAGNRSLSFFAGGWGRGSCEVKAPENWVGNWHHIAGVSTGTELKIFIDGIERGNLHIEKPVNLSVPARWMLGRNEEFPGERTFDSEFGSFSVFTEALSTEEIDCEMKKTKPDITR